MPLGSQAKAQSLVGELQDRAAYVAERAVDGERPRVFCIDWLEPLRNTGQWTPELVELAGGVEGLAEKWGKVPGSWLGRSDSTISPTT